jgi:hypothetical protein
LQTYTLELKQAKKTNPCKLYSMHAVKPIRSVKPVGSPFSSPLGLQLALRLLTSPAGHLSAHLEAIQP